MAQFIRVGKIIVNLDRVTHAVPNQDGTLLNLYFSDGAEDYVTFRGDQVTALTAYLSTQVYDVLGEHDRAERAQRERDEEDAAYLANCALLEHCTQEEGHAWSWSAYDAYSCRRCGAKSGVGDSRRVIELWGGSLAPEDVR